MTEDQSSVLPRDFVGYGARPPKGTWPGGAKVALNVVVNIEEGSERSFPAGDNWNEGLTEAPRKIDQSYRDFATESIYEYGSRAGIHRLLRLFGALGVDATMFAAAQALEVNEDVATQLRDSDHEVCPRYGPLV